MYGLGTKALVLVHPIIHFTSDKIRIITDIITSELLPKPVCLGWMFLQSPSVQLVPILKSLRRVCADRASIFGLVGFHLGTDT